MSNDEIAMNLTIAAVDRWLENSSATSGQEVGREIAAMYREIFCVLEQISPDDDDDDDEDDDDEPAIRPPLAAKRTQASSSLKRTWGSTVHEVTEALRLPSPAPLPQSIAFDGEKLWMGSIETNRLYAIDPRQWRVIEEGKAPGKPWGMTVVGDELRVICGEGDDDDRIVRRFVPGHGFKSQYSFRCPDGTGSQLSYDGTWLYVSQWYNRRILGLDDRGNVVREIGLPHQVCGQCYVDGAFYLVSTDDEETGEYFLTKVSAGGDTRSEDLARIPFAARALAYDGARFWTNHREANQIVAFER